MWFIENILPPTSLQLQIVTDGKNDKTEKND